MGSISSFAAENGWFLLLQRMTGGALRRGRDALLARQLHTSHLKLGRNPKLSGVRHIQVGVQFSAADNLWIDAITHFQGIAYTPQIIIGSNVNFSNNVHLGCTNRLVIKDGVLIGSNVIITDHGHGNYVGTDQSSPEERPGDRRLTRDGSVVIGRNVWIGDGVAVLAGADIGEGSIIGATSVVTGPIPPYTVAVGAPAVPIRQWDATSKSWRSIERNR